MKPLFCATWIRPATLVAVTRSDELVAIAELDDGVLRPRKVFPR